MSGRAELAIEVRRAMRAAKSDGDAIAVLDELGPLIACQVRGHLHRPNARLGRFRNHPWRCTACHRWLITRHIETYAGGAWLWEDVTHETEAPDA